MGDILANLRDIAIDDLEHHTLASIDTLLGRVIYIASTRDCNSGNYVHEGLSLRYNPLVAQEALASFHQALFAQLVRVSLADLVSELSAYFESLETDRAQILRSWQELRAYQLLVPSGSDSFSSDLFTSNMKLALAILRARQMGAP